MQKKVWEENTLSNAVLKNIAYLTMFIDHFFAVVFMEMIRNGLAAAYGADLFEGIYWAGRAIGRIAFVLFSYLAVEGFLHTRSRSKYLLRLGTFALVSEIPFDLAFSGQIIDPQSQNVYFTLFLGVLVLTVWEWTAKKIHTPKSGEAQGVLRRHIRSILLEAMRFGAVVGGCVAAYCLHTDYKYMGVLLIFILYLMHGRGLLPQMAVAGCVMFLGIWSANCLRYEGIYTAAYLFRFSARELYGLFAFIPIALYNGKIGRQLPKAVCYGFYPVHLLLLYGIAQAVAGM